MASSTFQIIQPISSPPPKKIPHPADVIKDITHKDIEGLNVVFINMPLRETEAPNTTPEGPLLLATNLRQNYGVNASIIDLNAYRIKDELAQKHDLPDGRHKTEEETRQLIERHFKVHGTPDIVALSGMITTLRWQERVCKIVREFTPHAFLISGSGLATELKTGLFYYLPMLDAIAHSEGDDIIVKICHDVALIKKNGFRAALNSNKLEPYYLGIVRNRHRFMYAGNRPRNLDLFPFADLELLREDAFGFKILEYYLGNAVWGAGTNNSSAAPFTMTHSTTSVSSRGCPFDCEYCYRGAQGEKNWGTRSAEHLATELVFHIKKYGIDFHGYPDDNFAVDINRIKEMVEIFTALGLNKIRWGTHTRLDEAAGVKLIRKHPHDPGHPVYEDPLRVKLMADAGCIYIGFGPESASVRVLKAIGKGGHTLLNGMTAINVGGERHEFPLSMVDGIRNASEVGIHSNCTWIMACPTETLEDLKETVRFIKWQEEFYAPYGTSPDAVNKKMFTMTWYPGTKMIRHERVRKELKRVFGLNFDENFEPVCDDKFYKYLVELDDATKVLHGENEEPLNFGDMSTNQFLEAREYVDSNHIEKILDM